MEHIAAFLLIVGCSQDLTQCKELPAPQPVFETIQDCDAILPASMRQFSGTYPKVLVQCFEVDPLLTETDAEIVWDITPNGQLVATVEPIAEQEVNIASETGSSERYFWARHH